MHNYYSEALEQQVALLRWSETERAAQFMGTIAGAWPSANQGSQWREITQGSLRLGETYYWSPDMTQLLVSVADTMPAWTFEPEALPSPTGFFWFARPLPMPLLRDRNGETIDDAIHAISWLPVFHADKEGIGLVFYTRPFAPVRSRVVPTCSWHWLNGQTQQQAWLRDAPEFDHSDTDHRLRRLVYFAAAVTFMSQKILVAPRQMAERHARKRLERDGWEHEPLVRVVQLRRKERQGQTDAVQPTDREYHCQWVVRGHWRQQWYPKVQRNQPRWILPYVKGPEDKPLKAPRATVFAVVR